MDRFLTAWCIDIQEPRCSKALECAMGKHGFRVVSTQVLYRAAATTWPVAKGQNFVLHALVSHIPDAEK